VADRRQPRRAAAHGTFPTKELDRRLRAAADDLETYESTARQLITELDEAGLDLEISDPELRRIERVSSTKPRSIEDQFRAEVDSILLHDRAEEADLARRIEFARWRLEVALEAAGIDSEELEQGGHRPPTQGVHETCVYPERVCRRWMELHAMRKEMVERNLYLALINVERYAHTRIGRMDLIQEGSSALFRAVDGFDWRRGLLFRTYAVHWLNQAFRSHLYNFGNTVRLPVYLQKAMKHVHSAVERLGNPKASVEQIAEEADIKQHIVESALGATRSTQSIDAALGGDGDGPNLQDLIGLDREIHDPYSPTMEDFSLQDGVEMALDRLSDRERLVVTKRFGLEGEKEHTLAEIAGELGVSLERVRQIQVRSMAKMATPKLRKAIDPFLMQ
jgi:RNA polymerase sigma factor (sigma-70 family)